MNEKEIRANFARLYAEVDLDVIIKNSKKIAAHVGPDVKMMAVIKTDGYGHGAVPIAEALEAEKAVCGFAVATAEEAHILRNAGIRLPILILGYVFAEHMEKLIQEDIRFTVFDQGSLEQLEKAAQKICKKAYVHIKTDTGMHRIGVRPDQNGMALVKKLKECSMLEVEGIFTHFARADETDKTTTEKQLTAFLEFVEAAEKILGKRIPIRHCANSAAVMEMTHTHLDMVRPGIILYGLSPSEEVEKSILQLEPALSLHSHVIYVKELEAGESVSYGGTFTAKEKMRIATIPAGYGDGYPRMLSGKGYVLIHGKKAPVLGRICMDQFMVDVSGIPEVKEMDPVVLLGKDGEEELTAEYLGKVSGRFHYELVCDLGRRIPRIYIRDGHIAGYREPYREEIVKLV